MNKQLIFVDDSGDPGFKSASSDNFVMAAVVFSRPDIAELVMQEIDQYRHDLGWNSNHEFKFAKNPKRVISEMLRRVSKYDFGVYAVYIEKHKIRSSVSVATAHSGGEKLYNWLIKELLCNIPIDTAKITIDGRSGKSNMKDARTYLRHAVGINGGKKIEIKFEDSVKTNLLQLADLIAGSINRSLQPNKNDARKYISIYKDKIAKIREIDISYQDAR